MKHTILLPLISSFLFSAASFASVTAINSISLNGDNSLATATIGGTGYAGGSIADLAQDNSSPDNGFAGFPYTPGTTVPTGVTLSPTDTGVGRAWDNNVLTGVAGGEGSADSSGGVMALYWGVSEGGFTGSDAAYDFFVFEDGGNDSVQIQAILSDNTLGTAVPIASWGSVRSDGQLYSGGSTLNGRTISGAAFSFTDLLDATGAALTDESVIKGILIGDPNRADFYEVYANVTVVPESETVSVLLGAIVLGLAIYRKRKAR